VGNETAGSGGYGPVLLDHFEHPRNLGEIPRPEAAVTVRAPGSRDSLQLTFRIRQDRIVEVRFRAGGCPVAIAAGSVATGLLEGRSIVEALGLKDSEVIQALGGLPSPRLRRSVLVARAVREALGAHPH
jgi:nitrogen fixation NifU-like protein